MGADLFAHRKQGDANIEGVLEPQPLQQPTAHPSTSNPRNVSHAQQRCSIPTHLLMNMEWIFHLGADDTESSFGNEKLKLF